MIQDIQPKIFSNAFSTKQPTEGDTVLVYSRNTILCQRREDTLHYPSLGQLDVLPQDCTFLFAIDNQDFFLLRKEGIAFPSGFAFENIAIFRTSVPQYLCFAGFIGYQLYNWYNDTRFCGRCGKPLTPSLKERMMQCDSCGNTIYPKISPGVIVAITHGDKLLMTKYAGREYTNYALVAGFTEVGETLEETVTREVMEEVGLKVKRVTYYKSQPWAFSSSLLCGFFAEVEGGTDITLETEELASAEWFQREEIPMRPDNISLTREMMMAFKFGER